MPTQRQTPDSTASLRSESGDSSAVSIPTTGPSAHGRWTQSRGGWRKLLITSTSLSPCQKGNRRLLRPRVLTVLGNEQVFAVEDVFVNAVNNTGCTVAG